MICAYCKCHVLDSDRKCPACGSAVFVTSKESEPGEPSPERQLSGEGEPPREQPGTTVVYQTIYQTVHAPAQKSKRSRWIALALCLLGGFLGLHRFYVGKNATGCLYLLTCGMFFFGAVADFFSILFGYFRDRDGLPLS